MEKIDAILFQLQHIKMNINVILSISLEKCDTGKNSHLSDISINHHQFLIRQIILSYKNSGYLRFGGFLSAIATKRQRDTKLTNHTKIFPNSTTKHGEQFVL